MDCHDEVNCAQKTDRIRELNDRLRTTGQGGRTLLTRAVAALPTETALQLLSAIRSFDAFNPSNDPWNEHDFGKVELECVPYFWKIDAHDLNLEFGSAEPADETVTCRVMTVMTEFDL